MLILKATEVIAQGFLGKTIQPEIDGSLDRSPSHCEIGFLLGEEVYEMRGGEGPAGFPKLDRLLDRTLVLGPSEEMISKHTTENPMLALARALHVLDRVKPGGSLR